MNGIKKKKSTGISLNKKVLIILEVAVLFTVVVLMCFVMKGNSSFKNKWISKNDAQNYTEKSIVYKEGLTFAPTKEDKNNKKDEETMQIVTEAQSDKVDVLVTNKPNSFGNALSDPSGGTVTHKPNSSGNTLSDPSGWSVTQIISKASDAVSKTKAYTGNLTVNHSERFTADVTECTGGEIVKTIVNLMIGWVVKPVDETLVYQNGNAVNSEGETVPIILPKRNGFSLSENGVKSATVQQTGEEYIIKINLVEESVGMYDIPQHNASAVGYLDVASFDISFMEVDSADIVYKGSSIELRINEEGFVTYANYKIPLHIEGSAHKGSISGSATFEGEQTEEWRLAW